MIIMAYEIKNKKNISTIGVHAGQEEVDETGSRVTPIYQTTSYVFDSSQQAAESKRVQAVGNSRDSAVDQKEWWLCQQ